jgi:hypothetical protein
MCGLTRQWATSASLQTTQTSGSGGELGLCYSITIVVRLQMCVLQVTRRWATSASPQTTQTSGSSGEQGLCCVGLGLGCCSVTSLLARQFIFNPFVQAAGFVILWIVLVLQVAVAGGC